MLILQGEPKKMHQKFDFFETPFLGSKFNFFELFFLAIKSACTKLSKMVRCKFLAQIEAVLEDF